MAEYPKTLRHASKWLVACCLAGAAAGYGLARITPPRFEATAKIGLSAGSLPAAVSSAAQAQTVNAAAQSAFSQQTLKAVIDKFSLYGGGNASSEAQVRQQVREMQQQIQIEPAGPVAALSFTASDNNTARGVCAELASRLVAEGNRAPVADHTTSAAELLQEQLKAAKKKLDDQQARVADFKRGHAGIDGDDSSESQRKLADLNRQLQAAESSLATAQEKRASLTDALFTPQPVRPIPRKPSDSSPATEALERDLAEKQAQLVTLQARYTPDHPDVVKVKTDIGNLQKKIADAKQAAAPMTPELPAGADASQAQVQAQTQSQIQSQMRDLDAQIREKTRDRARLEQEIGAAQAQLAANPMLEIEYSDLKSAEAAAKSAYDDLAAKLDQASKAEAAADAQQRAARPIFKLAAPPTVRAFPNFGIFTIGGAFGGLLLGAVMASWSAWRDKTLRTEADVERLLGLPTFAVIPFVDLPGGGRGNPGPWGDVKKQEERMAS